MTRRTKLGSVALIAALCMMALAISTANAQTAAPTQPPTQTPRRANPVRTLANALLGAAEKATNLSHADTTSDLGSVQTPTYTLHTTNAHGPTADPAPQS